MSKLSVTVLVALLAFAVLGIWLYAANEHVSGGAGVSVDRPVSSQGYEESLLGRDGESQADSSDEVTESAIGIKPLTNTKGLIQVGDETWGVKTAAEAAWLNRNFFPTKEQLALYGGMRSPAELPRDGVARSGADVVIAENIAINDPDNRDKAIAVLKSAAESGSTYALQSMARINARTSNNPVDAEAYYRAAVLRGDWAAGLRAASRLGMEENYVADVRSYQIISELNSARRNRGMSDLQVDTRPGLDGAIGLLGNTPPRQNGD